MYKIRHILIFISHILTKTYISYAFKKKRIFVINGLRRSGNHAFINWFSSALEGTEVIFDSGWISPSATRKTLLFNEANYRGVFSFFNDVRSSKSLIKDAAFIMVSLEDYIPDNLDPYIPWNSENISITRSTLNLISSRLQRSINQAKLGLDRGDMKINEMFFETINWLNSSDKLEWDVWNFDLWMCDTNNYRDNFLKKFNLHYNINPGMSTQGGGSSFSGDNTSPSIVDVTNRWKSVDWPERILKLLEENSRSSVLNQEEKDFLIKRNFD